MRPFEGKTKADIYDLCVLPENPNDPLADLGVVEVELRRIETFAEDAQNSEQVKSLLASVGRN
jgi:hypothetical protein